MNRFFELEPDTARILSSVIDRHFASSEIRPCNFHVEANDEDVWLIHIGICHNLSARPIDPKSSLSLLKAIQHALHDLGDERLPVIEEYFEDSQAIKGFQRAC